VRIEINAHSKQPYQKHHQHDVYPKFERQTRNKRVKASSGLGLINNSAQSCCWYFRYIFKAFPKAENLNKTNHYNSHPSPKLQIQAKQDDYSNEWIRFAQSPKRQPGRRPDTCAFPHFSLQNTVETKRRKISSLNVKTPHFAYSLIPTTGSISYAREEGGT